MDIQTATQIQLAYCQEFIDCDAVGAIEGDAGGRYAVATNCLSVYCHGRAEDAGCPVGELALIVDYFQPHELQIDPATAPAATFPRNYRGLPVYYRRGHVAHALGKGAGR